MKSALAVAVVCAVSLAACQAPGFSSSPSPVTTHGPGDVECPDGKPARSGLQNFGAYIGTWQENRRRDSEFPTDYAIAIVPGHIAVRCSTDGFVIVEDIHRCSPRLPARRCASR